MNKNIVELSNIYMEDVFEWFYRHIGDSSGDGAAQIVCENYKEVAEYFEEWMHEDSDRKNHLNHLEKMEFDDGINFTDLSDENFIFTSKIGNMFDGEYTFLIKENCPSCRIIRNNKTIKKYNE